MDKRQHQELVGELRAIRGLLESLQKQLRNEAAGSDQNQQGVRVSQDPFSNIKGLSPEQCAALGTSSSTSEARRPMS